MSGIRVSAPTEWRFTKASKIFLPGAAGFIIRSGWAFDYVMLDDGQRQVTAIHMPGDYVAVARSGRQHCEGIEAATAFEIETFTADALSAESKTGRVWAAVEYAERTRCEKLRTWLTVNGRKPALARCAHFLCEVHERIAIRHGEVANSFLLPLFQEQIGDATGLTGVHVNRMLRSLKDGGIAEVCAGRVMIYDIERLRQIAGFDRSYLDAEANRDEVHSAAAIMDGSRS